MRIYERRSLLSQTPELLFETPLEVRQGHRIAAKRRKKRAEVRVSLEPAEARTRGFSQYRFTPRFDPQSYPDFFVLFVPFCDYSSFAVVV